MARFRSPQVVLFSTDVERATDFYAALGFDEAFRTPTDRPPIHVDLVVDGYRIGIASVESTRGPRDRRAGRGQARRGDPLDR